MPKFQLCRGVGSNCVRVHCGCRYLWWSPSHLLQALACFAVDIALSDTYNVRRVAYEIVVLMVSMVSIRMYQN